MAKTQVSERASATPTYRADFIPALGRDGMNPGSLLAGLMGEDCDAQKLLAKQGIRQQDFVNYVSHGIPMSVADPAAPGASLLDSQLEAVVQRAFASAKDKPPRVPHHRTPHRRPPRRGQRCRPPSGHRASMSEGPRPTTFRGIRQHHNASSGRTGRNRAHAGLQRRDAGGIGIGPTGRPRPSEPTRCLRRRPARTESADTSLAHRRDGARDPLPTYKGRS